MYQKIYSQKLQKNRINSCNIIQEYYVIDKVFCGLTEIELKNLNKEISEIQFEEVNEGLNKDALLEYEKMKIQEGIDKQYAIDKAVLDIEGSNLRNDINNLKSVEERNRELRESMR